MPAPQAEKDAEKAAGEVSEAVRDSVEWTHKSVHICFLLGAKETMIKRLRFMTAMPCENLSASHDRKEGLKRTADDLSDIFSYLGKTVKSIIWGEGVWQKGEVIGTKAMDEAYHAGKNIGR